jgi:hypothetical protein
LENRPPRSVHSRDRGGRPAGRWPSRSHDLRHTRLDALELGKCRQSCSARARVGLDTGALGPRICDRSSRSHPGVGARVSIHRAACLSDLVRQRPLSARRGETRCDTYRNRHACRFEAEDGRLETSACGLMRKRIRPLNCTKRDFVRSIPRDASACIWSPTTGSGRLHKGSMFVATLGDAAGCSADSFDRRSVWGPGSERGADLPLVAEWIGDTAEAPAVLVLHGGRFGRTGRDGLPHHAVGIFDDEQCSTGRAVD